MPERFHFGPVITSRGNARVKALRASFNGDARRPGDLLGLEGEHLLLEAAASGLELEAIFLRAGNEQVLNKPAFEALDGLPCFLLSAEVFSSALDTGSPQGIAAMARIPSSSRRKARSVHELYLLVEQLQDAGNLGTLLRTAEAFGFGKVFATPGTVNEWNPKVVRASAGSVFRLPVERGRLEDIAAGFKAERAKLVASVACSEAAVSSLNADLREPCAIMIGNEGAGLTETALALADELVHIPSVIESLNAAVAGTTLMYEALRQNFHSFASLGGSSR